jgi:tRNA(Ile)-lysidine synthase
MLRESMFPAGSRCLVMVSGGQDSLTLLHLLSTGRGRKGQAAHVHALHINHHLRGEESDADEALVVRTCGLAGVSLTVVHRPIEKAGGNVQETARDARRGAAMVTAVEQGCDRIALGHTADDQVETMLYRLGRYGGLASFVAMRACDPPWVRPLLECRRADTAAYCREHGLEFARDRGNAYPGYARTAIREEVVPVWEAAMHGAVEAACRAAEVAAEMQELVAAAVADAAPMVIADAADADCPDCDLAGAERLSASALLALDPALRRLVLHTWLEGRARPVASRAGVLAVESLLEIPGSAHRSLAGGYRALKEYDRLTLVCARGVDRAAAQQQNQEGSPLLAAVPLAVPGEVQWQDATIRAERVAGFTMPDVSREAFIDAASLPEPLSVRGYRPGDRLRPFGAPGTRKLQDVFVDLRVPAAQRSTWPLVMSGERIVWVCGLVQAEEGRIGGHTKDIVRLSWGRT